MEISNYQSIVLTAEFFVKENLQDSSHCVTFYMMPYSKFWHQERWSLAYISYISSH